MRTMVFSQVVRLSGLLAAAVTPMGRDAFSQRADTVVRVARAPMHAGIAALISEVRIGLADGATEYLFGRVRDVAVERDGSIYVLDQGGLRKYASTGTFVKTFGRRGQGPGEYVSPVEVVAARDGRVLVLEDRPARLLLYSADGGVLPAIQLPRLRSRPLGGDALMVDSAGRIAIGQLAVSGRTIPEAYWVRFRQDGTLLDTLHAPPFARPQAWLSAPDPPMFMTVPFAALQAAVLSPLGYFVTGFGDRYAFELHPDPRGAITSVRRDVRPVPLSERQRDSARAAATESMRRSSPSWSWNGPDVPRSQAFYYRIVVADDGRIWVPLIEPVASFSSSPAGTPPPTPRAGLYDVFEPTGSYIGQVEVPANVQVFVRRGDNVWGMEMGADDVPRVVRYRIGWK